MEGAPMGKPRDPFEGLKAAAAAREALKKRHPEFLEGSTSAPQNTTPEAAKPLGAKKKRLLPGALANEIFHRTRLGENFD